MEFQKIVKERRSVKKYDTSHEIANAELKQIFELVRLSPSSFNLQHARFVVVRDPERKKQLRKAASGQEQVETSSAAIVVVGKRTAHQDAGKIYAEEPVEVREKMVPMIHSFYDGKDRLQRDEAIRSGALWAMSLMYAAYELGYQTGPMIGFDPVEVSSLLELDAEHFPVMMVVIGKQEGSSRPRAYRHPVSDFVIEETLNGPGIS